MYIKDPLSYMKVNVYICDIFQIKKIKNGKRYAIQIVTKRELGWYTNIRLNKFKKNIRNIKGHFTMM